MADLSFKNWLSFNEGKTSGKTGLYPLGYGGIGLYPLQTYLPPSADALLYISIDDRLYKNGDGPPFDIRHLPGEPKFKGDGNNGTKAPFDIRHIEGPEPNKKFHSAKDNKPFSINHIEK